MAEHDRIALVEFHCSLHKAGSFGNRGNVGCHAKAHGRGKAKRGQGMYSSKMCVPLHRPIAELLCFPETFKSPGTNASQSSKIEIVGIEVPSRLALCSLDFRLSDLGRYRAHYSCCHLVL